MKKIIGIIIISFLGFLPFSSLAQEYDFIIEQYDTQIAVQSNGDLDISETIDVMFNTQKHGIFRAIPYTYGQRMVPIVNIKVPNHQFTTYKENGYQMVKIGDPDQVIEGQKEYTIHYTVRGGVKSYSGYQELYWNIVGTEWSVPILKSTFQIIVPFPFSTSGENGSGNWFAYHGIYGEQQQISAIHFGGSAISGEYVQPLQPNEGITIGLQFENNPYLLPQKNPTTRFIFNYWVFVVPFLLILYCFRLWYIYGRDHPLPDITSYYPPENLSAPELKLLLTRNIEAKDVTSLIYARAARGLIMIEEKKEKSLLGSIGLHIFDQTSYVLKKINSKVESAPLADFELTLFNTLFSKGDEVDITKDATLYQALESVCSTLYSRFEYGKYYTKESNSSLRKVWFLAIVLAFIGILYVFIYNAYYYAHFALFENNTLFPTRKITSFLAAILSLIIVIIFGSIMRAKTNSYEKLLSQIRGFRTFIDKVEKVKLQALLKQDPLFIDKILPYVIVLGLAPGLLKIADQAIPGGYHPIRYSGNNTLHATHLSSAIHSIGSSSWTASPTSSSGGGFGGGGGGFSGGGGGGGGGGSR